MQHQSYLTPHPTVLKKVNTHFQKSTLKSDSEIDIEKVTSQIIQKQKALISQMGARITAYQVQIEAEINCRVDHRPYIQAIEREITQIRNEETYINEQIKNCQLVQNSVTPMQYYLWKKKQRINTYDASIAQVYKLMQKEKQEIQSTIEKLRSQIDQLSTQIQNCQQKITILHTGPIEQLQGQLINQASDETVQQLVELSKKIKDQYLALTNNIEILQQNKDIVCMQVIDNIKSIESTLKSYFDTEKAKLVKEFKQMQIESRNAQVSPLTSDQQNYKLDPLLSDYSSKLKQMAHSAPQSVRNIIAPVMHPMSWEKFHWKDFLEIEPKSQQIYTQYRQLQTEYSQNEQILARLQTQIKEVSHQIVTEQLRSSEISENIRKLKKNLKK